MVFISSRQGGVRVITIYLRKTDSSGNHPVKIENFSPAAISNSAVEEGLEKKIIEKRGEFELTIQKYVRGKTTGLEIILETKKEIKNISEAGKTYTFYVKDVINKGYSVLNISKKLEPIFLEFLWSCFKWLFEGLVFEVETNGGAGETETASHIRTSLVTRYEGRKI